MSKWSDEEARFYLEQFADEGEDLALRVYTTRLLGRDPSLVLHGGGNTSVKTTAKDEWGREVDVLCVKGSGWDMGNIEAEGLPAVLLDPLRDFESLDALSDEDMVNGVRRHLLDAHAPNPSVETLLHAFIPEKFIDHTHADDILALADQPDAEAVCRDLFGDSMGIVPYIMPGFQLAKAAAEAYRQHPGSEGLILINHGIFTYGPTARAAYERMIDKVRTARTFLHRKGVASMDVPQIRNVRPPAETAALLTAIRGCLLETGLAPASLVLQRRESQETKAFFQRPDWLPLTQRGTVTPDHVIRTKRKPLALAEPRLDDPVAFRDQIRAGIADYAADYRAYFDAQVKAKGVERTPLHPLPLVFAIPGLGVITAGKTEKEAGIAADIYEHTINVIQKAETVGRYEPLPGDLLFDMEYWSLEQAKLGKKKPRPLEGKVAVLTGAAGGIGRATAEKFAAAGCHLVLNDLEAAPLMDLATELRTAHGAGTAFLTSDITAESNARDLIELACDAFGGIDILISNAGRAFSGPMATSTGTLMESLAVNLYAHQYLAAAAVQYMTLQGAGGCLLFNASKSAFNPGPDFGPYSVPKAGVIALMKQYAVEYATDGIRANAVNADRIRTGLFKPGLLEERARARGLEPDAYFRANLLGIEVLAEDVADAFYHLCISRATTAAVLTVDGGNIAASPR